MGDPILSMGLRLAKDMPEKHSKNRCLGYARVPPALTVDKRGPALPV